jgi:curved DNA-binding protein CbpA
MVEDPYMILGLEHGASQDQIKRAYRTAAMSLHPDRLTRRGASSDDIAKATNRFSRVTGAYSLLSDPEKKKAYDHVYKYGGYDEITPSSHQTTTTTTTTTTSRRPNKKQNRKGVGYVINDPFVFIMSKGKTRSSSIAGIQLPSKFKSASPENSLKVAFSSAKIEESPSGTMTYSSKTTQFVGGRKLSTSETTTVHKDGRRETVIEGDDFVERRVSTAPKRKRRPSIVEQELDGLTSPGGEALPWYLNTWNAVRDNLTSCHNPCSVIRVQ